MPVEEVAKLEEISSQGEGVVAMVCIDVAFAKVSTRSIRPKSCCQSAILLVVLAPSMQVSSILHTMSEHVMFSRMM